MKAELQVPKPRLAEGTVPDSRENARQRTLFLHHPDAVLLVELGGCIVEANPAASKMLGWTREELLARRVWDLVVGVTRLEMQEWMRGRDVGRSERVLLNLRTRLETRLGVEARVQRVDDNKEVCFVVSCRELVPPDDNTGSSATRENGDSGKRWALQLQRHNEALVEAEQRLRLAMELGRVGLWVWNASDTTNPGHWSDQLKEIFGVPLDAEVTHEMFLNCVHPDDRAMVDEAVRKAITGHDGGRYSLEYRSIRARDGSEGWVLARGQAFLDEAGQPLRFIGTVVDITERKRAEEALAVLNAGLEQTVALRTTELVKVIDTIPGLVWSSLPDGSIEYLNQRWLEYTGLSLQEASGWGWQRAIHPDDLGGLVEYWKSIITDGVAGEYEARLRRHDGAYRWFLFRGVPLRDADGEVIKWYGTNTDVEDLRNSRHVARGQAEALRQTLEALSHESDPDQLLAHVLRTIGARLGAHSIGVW
jgi:PAS domain S-box-containing protein